MKPHELCKKIFKHNFINNMVKLETQKKRNKAMAYKAILQTSFEHNECNWGKVISICIHFRPNSLSTIQRSSLNTFLDNYYG